MQNTVGPDCGKLFPTAEELAELCGADTGDGEAMEMLAFDLQSVLECHAGLSADAGFAPDRIPDGMASVVYLKSVSSLLCYLGADELFADGAALAKTAKALAARFGLSLEMAPETGAEIMAMLASGTLYDEELAQRYLAPGLCEMPQA